MQNGTEADIDEIGFFRPQMTAVAGMAAGEVGYVITGLKDVAKLRVGDTLTSREQARRPSRCPATARCSRSSSAALFPIDTDRYEDLRDALEKLALNDAALSWEPETSDALGFGFRCGFLGLLHMDIVRERLEREYDLELLATTPNVSYVVDPDQRRRARGPQPRRPARPGRDRVDHRALHPRLADHARRSSSAPSWSSARRAAAPTSTCTT